MLQRMLRRALLVAIAVVLGLALRLILAVRFGGDFDAYSYEIVIGILRRGGNVYAETARYNYSPLWSYVLLSLSGLADLLHLPYHTVIRSFLTVVDACTALLVWRLASRRAALVYWLNPVSIMIVGYQGQFETLAFVPLLLAVYLRLQNRLSRYRLFVFATLALVIKQSLAPYVWLLFALLLPLPLAIASTAAAAVIWLASFIPFWSLGSLGIVANVFNYRSYAPGYGMGQFIGPLVTPLFIAGMLAAPFLARRLKLSLPQSFALVALFYTVLGPSSGNQLMLQVVLCGLFWPSLFYWPLTIGTTLFFLLNGDYLPLGGYGFPNWNPIWYLALGWLAMNLYLRDSPRRVPWLSPSLASR